jgi:hypothetical protein
VTPGTTTGTVNVIGNTAHVQTHSTPGAVINSPGCLINLSRSSGTVVGLSSKVAGPIEWCAELTFSRNLSPHPLRVACHGGSELRQLHRRPA